MLRSAKAAYFHDLASSLKNAPGKFWRHFQSLSRCSKPACEIQVSAMADVFNDHFLSIPYKTISNVVSAVPASEYMDRFCDLTVPTLEFVPGYCFYWCTSGSILGPLLLYMLMIYPPLLNTTY